MVSYANEDPLGQGTIASKVSLDCHRTLGRDMDKRHFRSGNAPAESREGFLNDRKSPEHHHFSFATKDHKASRNIITIEGAASGSIVLLS